ncbi:hypothetical protein [Paenibacillus sp. YIM B09110]|uniref:hypothetical protein n=1 Tax=Paenibacillus sp. YIM B09110 TaxID=3126102 RepID=UPI00301CB43E
MKQIKMSLVSTSGKVVNEWSVPYARRHDAIEHAMDRAEQEGHAGVIWSLFQNGVTRHIAFDSHDPAAILRFAHEAHRIISPVSFIAERQHRQHR